MIIFNGYLMCFNTTISVPIGTGERVVSIDLAKEDTLTVALSEKSTVAYIVVPLS